MITQKEKKIMLELIEKHENIYLFHHVNPDGDCTASSFGLAEVLRLNYPDKKIKVVASNEYSPKMKYIFPWLDWSNTITQPKDDEYLSIVGDTSVENRVEHFSNFKNTRGDVICFDHHENELDFNANIFWREKDYPAAGIMVEEIVRVMDWKLNERAALIINHGIVTDTGSFKYNYADSSAQRASANLLEYISNEEQLKLTKAADARTIKDIEFQGHVMANFEIKDNKIAYYKVTQDVLDKFELMPDEASKIYLLSGIVGIETWIMFIQYQNFVRVEFRSVNLWVNEIANHFGGGGHKHSSGCHIKTMEGSKKVIDYIAEQIKK